MNNSLTASDSPAQIRLPSPNGTNWLIFCNEKNNDIQQYQKQHILIKIKGSEQ